MFKITKMDKSVCVKQEGMLEVNLLDAVNETAAKVVEVISEKPFTGATIYIVYGEMTSDEATEAVINYSSIVASAYNADKIELGTLDVRVFNIDEISESDEMKEYYYPIIIKK